MTDAPRPSAWPDRHGEERESRVDVDEQPVERVGGRLRAGVEPVEQSDVGIGGEPEHRRQVAAEVGDPHSDTVIGFDGTARRARWHTRR